MTITERIRRIADKAKLPYAMVSQLINSTYGRSSISVEDKLKLLEKEYEIK